MFFKDKLAIGVKPPKKLLFVFNYYYYTKKQFKLP